MSTVRAPARHARRPAPDGQHLGAPAPQQDERPRHLRIVDPTGQRRGRLGRTGALVTVVVFVGLFALAVFHTVLVQGQVRLDALDDRVATQQEQYQRARLEVARLEAPERVVAEAQFRLGMVVPDDVVYLTPERPAALDGSSSSDLAARTDDTWSTVKPYLERTP